MKRQYTGQYKAVLGSRKLGIREPVLFKGNKSRRRYCLSYFEGDVTGAGKNF